MRMSAIKKWFKKIKTHLRRTMIRIDVSMMHLTDQEKKLLVKMRLEGDNIYESTVSYNYTDPFEEKEREKLKEKLRIREKIIDRFLEVDI